MKIISYIVTLLITITFFSCNSSSVKGEDAGVDTIWNDRVQDTFFGVSFGSSKEDVIAALEKEGFNAEYSTSTENFVHFFPTESIYYSFAGRGWTMLDVSFSNNKFYAIRFMEASEDKASAISQYESLYKKLIKKYKETIIENKDSTIYKQSVFLSKDIIAMATCYRYESVSGRIYIGMALDYISHKHKKSDLDEL